MGIEKGAAALKWDRDKDEAPRLIAAGRGYLADKILSLAEESSIPLVEEDNLTDLLLTMKPGREIPPELFALAAEVYVFLMELDSNVYKSL
jgi:flagellar biosynthesis protein